MGLPDAQKEAGADQLQQACNSQLTRTFAALVHHRGAFFRVHAGQVAEDKPLDDAALFLSGRGIGNHQPFKRLKQI